MRKKINPSPTLNQLRLNFWAEYDRCVGQKGRKFYLPNIVAGVCSLRLFKAYLGDVEKLAWVLTPVQSYTMGVQDVLETCLYKMRQALDNVSIYNSQGLNAQLF